MPRNRGGQPQSWIPENRMPPSLAEKTAAMRFHVRNEIPAFHRLLCRYGEAERLAGNGGIAPPRYPSVLCEDKRERLAKIFFRLLMRPALGIYPGNFFHPGNNPFTPLFVDPGEFSLDSHIYQNSTNARHYKTWQHERTKLGHLVRVKCNERSGAPPDRSRSRRGRDYLRTQPRRASEKLGVVFTSIFSSYSLSTIL